MKRRTMILGGTAMVALGACSSSKFKRYNGPEVTYVVVNKSQRRMMLLHHNRVLEDYRIKLGFAPVGHKAFEGDGRTPEGRTESTVAILTAVSTFPSGSITRMRAISKTPVP